MISSRKVTIMSGISGVGKTTEMDRRASELNVYTPMLHSITNWHLWSTARESAIHVSADHYFMDPHGEYNFNPEKIGAAHGLCLRNYITGCQNEVPHIFVDNTNCTNEELAPYIAIAQAYHYTVEVVTIMCANMDDVKAACARNEHGVPFEGAVRMHEALLNRKPPFHWSPDFGVTFTQMSPVW